MSVGETIPVIKDIFHFTYIRNEGAAFGMLSEHRWVFMTFSTIAIVGIIAYLIIARPKDKLLCLALTLICAGGIGNMIDRIAYGTVVDFIDFRAFPELWKWIFNGADSFVCVGAGLLILALIIDLVKEYKAEAAKKNAECRVQNAE